MKQLYLTLLMLSFALLTHSHAQLMGPVKISHDYADLNSSRGTARTADLDSDGDIDIVKYDEREGMGTLLWYENFDDKDKFSAPKIIGEVDNWNGTADFNIVDIDNDGMKDILVIHHSEFFWFRNELNSSAKFSDRKDIEEGLYFSGLKSKNVDINGDNILDILYLRNPQDVMWKEGVDGKGRFKKDEELVLYAFDILEVEDIDNDGDKDIVSTNNRQWGIKDTTFIEWHENINGKADFSMRHIIDTLFYNLNYMVLKDVDNDNDLDIFIKDKVWYRNNVNINGTWEKSIIKDYDYFSEKVFLDYDNDGDLDFISRGELFENFDSNGEFKKTKNIPYSTGSIIEDMDGNGILDFVSNSIITFRYDYGNLVKMIDYENHKTAGKISEERDMNKDGILDILYSGYKWLSFDNSESKFTNPYKLNFPRYTDYNNILFEDIDSDGKEERITISRPTETEILIFKQLDSIYNYKVHKKIQCGDVTIVRIEVVDLDNDGDLDILVQLSDEEENGFAWLENIDGNANFSGLKIIIKSNLSSIMMNDVDSDGDFDILGYGNTPDKGSGFFYFENNINSFSDMQTFLKIDSIKNYLYKDINNDGNEDLIYITKGNNLFFRLNNGGIGNFSDPIKIKGINQPNEFFLKDFDLDGDYDLLVSEFNNNATDIWAYENIGNFEIFKAGKLFYKIPDEAINIGLEDYTGNKYLDIAYRSKTNGISYFVQNYTDKATVIGKVFYDENENEIFDNNEKLINPDKIEISPEALSNYPSNFTFNFALNAGIYDIQCFIPSGFDFTTPGNFSIDVIDETVTEVFFGVKPNDEFAEILASITSAPTRCGFEVPFWIDFQNIGTVTGDVNFSFEMDTLVEFVSAIPAPDSIVGNIVYWSYNDLFATHSGQFKLVLQMPDVEYIGDYLSFNINSETITESNNNPVINSYGYRSQVNCAYDPNDKLVLPAFENDKNYTFFGDTLDYTVRFQNTGTDTAFTVIIEDYLDENLDYSTMEFVGASHPCDVMLDSDLGKLIFKFGNILLPDSTTNERESHGFIRYNIQHKKGLKELTRIENKASIFFDFNPPILTNIVENYLISSYPFEVDILHINCKNEYGILDFKNDISFVDSIRWSNGENNSVIDSLEVGLYELSIFYADGVRTDTSFTVSEINAIEIQAPTINEISCKDAKDGAVTLNVNGGIPEYIYDWNDVISFKSKNNLPPGVYNIIITDANKCKDSLQFVLKEPEELSAVAQVKNEIDHMKDGSITILTSGGNKPYNYIWSHNPTYNSNYINDLKNHEYSVNIIDANGCELTEIIDVNVVSSDFEYQLVTSPNPSIGNMNISLSFPKITTWQLNISNNLGQLVRQFSSPEMGNTGDEIDFSLQSGTYHITLFNKEKSIHSETVIVR